MQPLLLLLLSLTPSAELSQDQGQEIAAKMETSPDTRELRDELLRLMRAGIDVKEPNHGLFKSEESGSLFDGSYDWHSCVIAHWCLLVAARTGANEELESWLANRLKLEDLRGEIELIKQRDLKRAPTFPYDEAWLLMMLVELMKRSDAPSELSQWRALIEDRLLSWLEERPFPEAGERGFIGSYGSWLNTYLLMRWSEPERADTLKRLQSLETEKLLPQKTRLSQLEAGSGYDFLWLPALNALAERSRGEPLSDYDPGAPRALPERVIVATVHPLGVAISRAWPDAYDAGLGDAHARARYNEHLAHFIARRDLWAGDFDACSHWLPQYLWIGLWLSDGRP